MYAQHCMGNESRLPVTVSDAVLLRVARYARSKPQGSW
jgi:hypothetical protein